MEVRTGFGSLAEVDLNAEKRNRRRNNLLASLPEEEEGVDPKTSADELAKENRRKFIKLAALLSAHFDRNNTDFKDGTYLDPLATRDIFNFIDVAVVPEKTPLRHFEASPDEDGGIIVDIVYEGQFFEVQKGEAVAVLDNPSARLSAKQAAFLTGLARSNQSVREQSVPIQGSDFNRYLLYLFSQDKELFGAAPLKISNIDKINNIDESIKQEAREAYNEHVRPIAAAKRATKAFLGASSELAGKRKSDPVKNALAEFKSGNEEKEQLEGLSLKSEKDAQLASLPVVAPSTVPVPDPVEEASDPAVIPDSPAP